MILQNINFFIPLVTIAFTITIGILYIWIYRKGVQDIIGMGIMILSLIWITAYIFEQSITANHLKILFDKLQYTGSILLPIFSINK